MLKKNVLSNIILIFFFLVNAKFFLPLIYRSCVKLQKLNLERVELERKIEKAKIEISNYNNKINTMEDEFEREKIARNRLQMIKKSEEIYRFINK